MKRRHRWPALALTVLAAASVSCGALHAPPPLPTATPSHANLLSNGGFEDGASGWAPAPPDAPPPETDSTARGGRHGLLLRLPGDAPVGEGRTVGVLQSVPADEFPETVSGYYRVATWEPHAASQNLRFVVSVRGGDFGDGFALHQIRFIIAGSDAAAKLLPGVAQVYISRASPPLRRWTYFAYPVKQAFAARFGRVPQRWDALDVSFEAGYDGALANAPSEAAAVSFDDLYAGPFASNPNRPADP